MKIDGSLATIFALTADFAHAFASLLSIIVQILHGIACCEDHIIL